MQKLRLAVIQTYWPGNRPEMVATYQKLIKEAAGQGAELICLQEFTFSPYFASVIDPENYRWAEPLHGGESDQILGQMARDNGVYLIGSIFEQGTDGKYWDTATLHNPAGRLAGFTRKVHIPQGDGYHEDHYFGGDTEYPIHEVKGVKLAMPTCYDQWFPEMSRICALNGAEFIFYPTAIGSEPTNPAVDTKNAWQMVMRGQAIANGVYIAAANRVGQEYVKFYGSSFICDPQGNLLAEASRENTEIIYADLDPTWFAEWRRLFPLLNQRRPAAYGKLTQR